MDSTLSALVARYPRVQWRREGGHYEGQHGQIVVTVWDDGGDLDGWRARGIVGTVRLFTRAGSAVEAVEKLAKEPEFADALYAAPVVPARVVEYSRYPDGPVTVERPMMMPGPAALGCPAVVGLVGVGCLGLWMGVEVVRWLTGGAS